MPTNLVASVTKLLTPELLSRIASGLGLDQAAIGKAFSAGVPAILAALTSLVGRPGGAAKLGDAVAQQQPGILANITNIIGGSGQQDLMNTGLNTLSSLLGGSTVSSLTSAVSKYAGIGETGSKGLMGLLGPLMMGVLGQQQRASGLDATGLAELLESQKGNIARAMPSGFADYLKGTGILDPVTSPMVKERTRFESDRQSSQWNWVLPVLGILALGALGWYLLGRSPTDTVAVVPPAKVEATTQMPATTFIVTDNEANDWIGRPVFSSDNKKIGEIMELKRGPDNKVTEVFVDTGTFLGMGAVRYRVTSDQVQQVKPDGLVLTLKESEATVTPQAGEQPKQ